MLRTVPKVGVEVVQVLPRTAGAQAGIRVGDIITTAGDVKNPTSAQMFKLFAAASKGGAFVVALTRGQDHRVVAIRKVP
jgi:S1-C subfamily serine protease